MDKKQLRVSWIDITKGLAIILVVLGHSIQSFGNSQDTLFRVIYSFHMPVFFVISGYTFKPDSPFKNFLNKKAKSLFLPYIGFVIVTAVYEVTLAALKGEFSVFIAELKAAILPTGLVMSDSYFINLWFLPALFVALMLIYLIFHLTSNDALRGGYCILVSIIAYLVKIVGNVTLPLCAEIGGYVVFWLYIGYMLKKIEDRCYDVRENKNRIIIFFALSVIWFSVFNYIGCVVYPGMTDSYRQLYFSNVLLSILTGFFGTVMLISVSKLIKNCTILEFFGRNSNIIYGLHFLLLGLVGQVMQRLPLYGNLTLFYVLLGTAIIIGCLSCCIVVKNKILFSVRKS